MNLSWASISFDAYHFDYVGEEGWHEHAWCVTAYWPAHLELDCREVQKLMWAKVAELVCEGRFIGRGLNEDVAESFLNLELIVRVAVDREGCGALFGA